MGSGRALWRASLDGREAACRPLAAPGDFQDVVAVEGEIEGEVFLAYVERVTALGLLRLVDPDLDLESQPADVTALLLEHALEPLFAEAERLSGRRLQLRRVQGSVEGPDSDGYGLEASFAGVGPAMVALRGDRRLYEALFAFARSLPLDYGRVAGLGVKVSLRFAATTLSAPEAQALAPGDMVVLDGVDPARVTLVANEYAAASAQIAGASLRLTAPFKPPGAGLLGEYLMTNPYESDGAASERIGRLSDMPVRIVFEIGRLDVPLSELANAGEGHVFVLPTPLSSGCSLVSGGAVIGRGEIVKVGDQFAVRVTSLAPR